MEQKAMRYVLFFGARHRFATTRICFWAMVSVFLVVCCAACASKLASTPQLTPSEGTAEAVAIVPTETSLSNDWASRWLRGIPCSPPCWEGITPGRSTAHETLTLLQANPLIANAQLKISKAVPDLGQIAWRWADGQPGGTARFHAQTSDQLIYEISPDFPTHVQLQDVIEAFGEPQYVVASALRNPDNSIAYGLRVAYLTRGILLITDVGSPSNITMGRDMKFDRIILFEPTEQTFKLVLGGVANVPEWLLPWQGYKEFDYYCRDLEDGRACQGQPRQ